MHVPPGGGTRPTGEPASASIHMVMRSDIDGDDGSALDEELDGDAVG